MRKLTRLNLECLEDRRLMAVVNIPTTLTGSAGSAISAPVNIDAATGVRAAEIRLSYDTAKLDIANAGVQAGSVWAANSDTQITANVNEAAGTIVIFISSATSLSNLSGSLATLSFTSVAGLATGSTAVLNLTSVRLNEGAIAVSPAVTAGNDSNDGLITISAGGGTGAGTISGFVFADANGSGAIDSNEAIAGVAITLTNVSTGATQQATTAADGSYSFSNLAAGSYQLDEAQPSAYFGTAANRLAVQLVAGTPLNNQNFVEAGLKPQFVYTRLLSTLVMPVGSTAWNSAVQRIQQDATAASTASSTTNAQSLQSLSLSQPQNVNSILNPLAIDSAVSSLVAEGESNASATNTNSSSAPPVSYTTEKDRNRFWE